MECQAAGLVAASLLVKAHRGGLGEIKKTSVLVSRTKLFIMGKWYSIQFLRLPQLSGQPSGGGQINC